MENESKSPDLSIRVIYNIVMGLLWTGLGVVILFRKQFNLSLNYRFEQDPILLGIFGGIAILYGGFRLFRAFQRKRK